MNKQLIIGILVLLITLSSVNLVDATIVSTFWTSPSEGRSITIENGQTATFHTVISANNPPIDYTMKLYRSGGILIKTLEQGTISSNSESFDNSIKASDYQTEGSYFVEIVATDRYGRDSERIDLTVIPESQEPENHDPIMDSIGDKTVNEGQLLQFTLRATDEDGDDVIFHGNRIPGGANLVNHFDNTATFTWIPDFDQAGKYQVTFTADDNNLGTDQETIEIIVNDVSGELDPGNPIAPYDPHPYHTQTNVDINTILTWKAGNTLDLEFDVYFGTSSNPTLVSANQDERSYNPGTLREDTTYYWRVVARDRDNDETSSITWRFTTGHDTHGFNHPPTIDPISDQEAEVGERFIYQVRAHDPDNDNLRYSLFDGEYHYDMYDSDFYINPDTGLISFIVTEDMLGNNFLTVQVSDGRGGIDQESFDLYVFDKDHPHGGHGHGDHDDLDRDRFRTDVRNTACTDDFDGDNIGTYKQIIETIDRETGKVISSQTLTFSCSLDGFGTKIVVTTQPTEDEDEGINWLVVAILALLGALIALLIAYLLMPAKKRRRPGSSAQNYRPYSPATGSTAIDSFEAQSKIPESYY
tara:strand:- start:11884 stop:13638 length:1755 start_codon:yes stop_codon:yes gene_type:complete